MASMQVEMDDQLQKETAATLNNHTKAEMQLIKYHSWSGDFTSVPETIPSDGGVARFEHLKDSQGSKAALCYTITNTAGTTYAAVLAWSTPADFNPSTSPNKVYAAIASKCIIDIITWDQIQMLLDDSESSVKTDIDGVCAEATISNNPTTNVADLQTNFQLSPTNHVYTFDNNNNDNNNDNNNNNNTNNNNNHNTNDDDDNN